MFFALTGFILTRNYNYIYLSNWMSQNTEFYLYQLEMASFKQILTKFLEHCTYFHQLDNFLHNYYLYKNDFVMRDVSLQWLQNDSKF